MIFATLTELNPVVQALIATTFTWLLTLIGAASVFLSKGINRRILDSMLGFTAGVMLSASFLSLLLPALYLAYTMKSSIPY